MDALAATSLSAGERELLRRFAEDLHAELGDTLHAVWLFGSRARGEHPGEDSDVDVLILVDDATWTAKLRARAILEESARALASEALAWSFSLHIRTPAWLEQRREIESFFIAEVDRDRIAVGSPG